MTTEKFKKIIWDYYQKNGRTLPWRKTRDPYKILVSEVMLQQTQVSAVTPKYEAFLRVFPTVESLAKAPTASVLKLWQGLGYNRRALNLKRMAEEVVKKYHGKIPRTLEELVALPGVGPASAGGVLAFAYNIPVSFIETNIRRVFIHFFFPKKNKVSDKEILPLVEKSLPAGRQAREWYWALYDYGAYLAKTVENPNRRATAYKRQSAFEGSRRQLRGKVLRFLLEHPKATDRQLLEIVPSKEKLHNVLSDLEKDGFILRDKRKILLC